MYTNVAQILLQWIVLQIAITAKHLQRLIDDLQNGNATRTTQLLTSKHASVACSFAIAHNAGAWGVARSSCIAASRIMSRELVNLHAISASLNWFHCMSISAAPNCRRTLRCAIASSVLICAAPSEHEAGNKKVIRMYGKYHTDIDSTTVDTLHCNVETLSFAAETICNRHPTVFKSQYSCRLTIPS